MRRTLLMLVMVAVLAVAGYLERDFLLEQYGKLKARFFPSQTTRRPPPRPATPPPTAGGDTGRAADTRPATQPTRASAPPRTQRPVVSQFPTSTRPLRDEPYVSNDTGTIDPGMNERDVYALWGPPASVRRAGDWTYLYFRNGCEYSCGTYDLVLLEHGKVVDAVLRWPGHNYSGQSSSPPGVVPLPTRGGDTLVVPPTPNP